jgi:hypothetical protein
MIQHLSDLVAQAQSVAAADAQSAVADAEARASILRERLRILTDEREFHVGFFSFCVEIPWIG